VNRIPLSLCILLLGFSFVGGGCSWVGRTAGKAQAKIERKATTVEESYHQGYREEKKKETPQKQDAEPDS
jgi:hypothetical protein